VVRLKRELQATSAQDQFAKWAKVQRQHDKAMADYDKKGTVRTISYAVRQSETLTSIFTAQGLKDFESTFNKVVNALRWLGVQGLRFLLQTYYQKTPMYWLPRGWVPYWGEWLLSFPRAPVGSVSIQVWFGACMAVTQIATSAVAAVWALRIQKEGTAETKAKGEPMKVGGRSAMEKKEL
jgi:hypothetical protein